MGENKSITTRKKINLSDDRGKGEDFVVGKILYEDDDVILGSVFDYERVEFKVLIYKETGEVISKELNFYYAENLC